MMAAHPPIPETPPPFTRADPTPTERSRTNAYASCPAATGETVPSKACLPYPDTAHRCGQRRQPVHMIHSCVCGYRWISESRPSHVPHMHVHMPTPEAQ